MTEPCIYTEKIVEIHTDLKNLKQSFEEFKYNDFHELKEKLNYVVAKMNKPRLPFWITWILTLCSGLIVGLIVLMVKK